MSVSGLTVWLNPLLVLVGLAVLFMLQTNDKAAAKVVYTTEAPVQISANH